MKHKYNAKQVVRNGRKYSSILESNYAAKLDLAKESGDLLFYLEQVPMNLPGNTKYRLDFLEFWAPKNGDQGEVVFTEVKGFDTPMGKLKLKQVEDIYNIEINVVRKN